MKRFSYYTLLLLTPLLLCIAACSDDDKDDVLSPFQVVKTTIDSDPAALSGEIELSDANFTYTVSGGDWCEVKKDGKFLTLTSGANYDFQNRTVEVVIEVGKKKYRVPVTQNGIVFELTNKARNHFNVSFPGGERTIDLLTNVQYDVVIPDEYKDWISVIDLGNNSHTIVVDISTERRDGEVMFKYLEKIIAVTINQFNYMSYTELLGPALMTYTNSLGERIETDIELEERVVNGSFTLKGTFESEIPRELPLYYLDDDTHNGELRFSTAIINPSFEDPVNHASIKSLACLLYADQYLKSNGAPVASGTKAHMSNSSYYYPSEFIVEGTGTRFKFIDIPGCFPSSTFNYRVARGIVIQGVNAAGSSSYGKIYDTIFDIEIFKE